MSGTEIAYAGQARRTAVLTLSEMSYGAMRCAVLGSRMVLCDVRYWARIWCYAMCGAELAYGAMRCA
eukprot:2298708-Rhodomonas_salina.5